MLLGNLQRELFWEFYLKGFIFDLLFAFSFYARFLMFELAEIFRMVRSVQFFYYQYSDPMFEARMAELIGNLYLYK